MAGVDDVVLPVDLLTRQVLTREVDEWWESMTLRQRFFIYTETRQKVQSRTGPTNDVEGGDRS